jgi:hypothetical protein
MEEVISEVAGKILAAAEKLGIAIDYQGREVLNAGDIARWKLVSQQIDPYFRRLPEDNAVANVYALLLNQIGLLLGIDLIGPQAEADRLQTLGPYWDKLETLANARK